MSGRVQTVPSRRVVRGEKREFPKATKEEVKKIVESLLGPGELDGGKGVEIKEDTVFSLPYSRSAGMAVCGFSVEEDVWVLRGMRRTRGSVNYGLGEV